MSLRVAMASRSEAGGRRHNEDDLRVGSQGDIHWAVLSDGAGGHSHGAQASAWVVRSVAHALQDAGAEVPDLGAVLQAAHTVLARDQTTLPPHRRMHATVVLLWIDARSGMARWAHVGDSRLYLVRRGRAQALTRDDSLVQQLVDAGLLRADEARVHPKRNQLLAALGGSTPPHPHVGAEALALRDGDAFLLCSDGWWGELELEDIEAGLRQAPDAEAWLTAMHACLAARVAPGHDNLSAVAVWVGEPAEITLSPAATR